MEFVAPGAKAVTNCLVEVESAQGGKLRLQLQVVATTKLVNLIRAFVSRLWLGDLDWGVAGHHHATHWQDATRERGYEGVHIEPAPDAEPTFPIGDDDSEEADLASSVATARCRHCQVTVSFPGFDKMLAFICPECGTSVKVVLPVQ